MAEELPVGFRFYPTEVEMLSFYLRIQLGGGNLTVHSLIPILDVFSVEPTQLPKLAGERCRSDGEQWLFFVPRQEREARGGRPSRTTSSGYWKATGSPGPVFSPDNRVIGVKRTMIFYIGKAPKGRKTKWKMNEYKAVDEMANGSTIPKLRHEFSICRIYIKSGSLRAFDRRPTIAYGIQRKLSSNGVQTSSRTTEAYRIERKFPSNEIKTSSRATETYVIERNLSSNEVETLSHPTIPASLENSYSGGDQVDLPMSFTTTQSNSEMVDGLSQPFWEWERMN